MRAGVDIHIAGVGGNGQKFSRSGQERDEENSPAQGSTTVLQAENRHQRCSLKVTFKVKVSGGFVHVHVFVPRSWCPDATTPQPGHCM